VLNPAFGSGGDRSGTTLGEIVAPQRDGEGDDGDPRYNDCPRLSTKSLEPLCIELDRSEDCRCGDGPTAVVARRPSSNGDDDDGPLNDERDLRYMEVGGTPSLSIRLQPVIFALRPSLARIIAPQGADPKAEIDQGMDRLSISTTAPPPMLSPLGSFILGAMIMAFCHLR
jgi:hypothetical protein